MTTHLLEPFRFVTMLGHDVVCVGHSPTENFLTTQDIESVFTEFGASQILSFFHDFPSFDVVQDEGHTTTYMLNDDYERFCQADKAIAEEQLSASEVFEMYNDVKYSSTDMLPMALFALEPLKVEDVPDIYETEKKDLYELTRSASIDDLTPIRQNGRKRSSFSLSNLEDRRHSQKKKEKPVADMNIDYLSEIVEAHVDTNASCDHSSLAPVSTMVSQLRRCDLTKNYMDVTKFLKRFQHYKHLKVFWDYMKDTHIEKCTNQLIGNKLTRAIVWKS